MGKMGAVFPQSDRETGYHGVPNTVHPKSERRGKKKEVRDRDRGRGGEEVGGETCCGPAFA